jgi:energy-coupling factor transporter ATP-binding protein EcfA2
MRKPNPFPGLRPFEADESHLFFGREAATDELLQKLQANRFIAVVGTSGSGKSSLVRAGMLPDLYGGFMTTAGSRWRIAVLRPGDVPIRALAQALAAPTVFGGANEPLEMQAAITEAVLRRGALGLIDVARQAKMPSR